MPTAAHTLLVEQAIDAVFDFLADGTNNPKWRSGVLDIARTSTTAGQGATYRQVMAGPGGRRIDGDYRITLYDRPHRLEFDVTAGPARPTGTFALTESAPGRTEVLFRLDLQPRGLMRLMTPMIAAQMRKEVAALDRLKGYLESDQ